MRKRGQAAMEFLMTYGWSLLVVLAGVSALAFFGVLNPAKFLPESCMLGAGFACEDFKVDETGIHLFATNGLGKDLNEFLITITNSQDNLCEGFIGYVRTVQTTNSGVTTALPLQNPSIFSAGETREIYSSMSWSGGTSPSIKCEDPGTDWTVCCTVMNANHGDGSICGPPFNLHIPLTSLDVCANANIDLVHCGNGALRCTTTVRDLSDRRGDKFKADLVVTYKEIGSSIYHQVIGQLVTGIE